jgi:tetratricopeptide (TPR) repeat protein
VFARFLIVGAMLVPAISAAQIDPKTALLERAGWEALAQGQGQRAAEAFAQALAADPNNARLHLGAATAAFAERRFADARAASERALTLDPGLASARALLGRTLHRLGMLQDAIRAFEILTAQAPQDLDARATLERWRREADLHDRMLHEVGERFTVSFDGPSESGAAAKAIDALDRAYWRIGALLGTYPSQPISVVLYSDAQFADITRSPPWAGGVYDGIIRVPISGPLDDQTQLDRVFAHELTHAIVHLLAARRVPTWLNEGLASALESDDRRWAEARVSAAPPVPLSRLPGSFGWLNGDAATLAYATSVVAVARLLDQSGGVAVSNLLRDLGSGEHFETAFAHRMLQTFAEFEQDLQKRF